MSTQLLHDVIETKVRVSRRRDSVGVSNRAMVSQNTRNVFFLDDMNMAATDRTNNQPSAELVRSLISLGKPMILYIIKYNMCHFLGRFH